jgi:hypothetical protein
MGRYRPKRVDSTFEKGERGEAQVKGNKKTIKLRFVESGNVRTFSRTRQTAKLRPGRWYVALNSDETEIWAFNPWSGQFTATVNRFAAKEGEKPVPKVTEGKDWTTVNFTVILEIVEPKKLSGVEIPHFLKYNFRETSENGKPAVGLASKGSRTQQLAEFLDITGAWNQGPMKWMDNVLPAFEKRILHEAVEFNMIVKNGRIDTLFQMNEPEVEDDMDWDDEPEEEEPVKESAPAEESDELDWEEDE